MHGRVEGYSTANFLDPIIRLAQEAPDRPALIHYRQDHQTILSRRELVNFVTIIFGHIRQRLADSTGVIVIILKHDLMQYPAYLAAIASGFIPSFLSPPTSKQDPDRYWNGQSAILQRLRPRAVIAYGDIAERLRPLAESVGAEMLLIDQFPSYDDGAATWRPSRVSPEQVLLLQHSSGTTGAHKGVAVTHGQATAQARAYVRAVHLEDASTVVSWLPPYHDMGLFTGFLLPLWTGAAVVSIDPFQWVARPEILFEALEAFHGTHCWLPNFAFAHLTRAVPAEARFDLSAIKALVSCSEVVKARTLDAFLERFRDCGVHAGQLCVCYAMAEAAFAVTQTPTGSGSTARWYDAERLERAGHAIRRRPGAPGARALVSNGRPIDGVELRIFAKPASEDAAPDNAGGPPIGEIAIRGECVFEGYFLNPDATQQAFDQGWYRTGDIGFLDNGELFVTGRVKDIIIVHGRNYYAHDIEAVVSSTPGVVPGRVAALGLEDEDTQSEEAVVIVETDRPAQEEDEVRRLVKRAVYDELGLTLHRVALAPRGWLVKTTSGKISRVANLERLTARGMETAS